MSTGVTDQSKVAESWRKAPRWWNPYWSRLEVLKTIDAQRLLKPGMAQAEVHMLLGTPGFSSETSFPGSGRASTYAAYRLNAAGDRYLSLCYDEHGRLIFSEVKQETFREISCDRSSPYANFARIKDVLKRSESSILSLTEVAEALGVAGAYTVSEEVKGGHVWRHAAFSWRVENRPYVYFVVTVDLAVENSTRAVAEASPLSQYHFMTYYPGCKDAQDPCANTAGP